jgi:hypothetical protein
MGPFPATTLHILCPKNFWRFNKGEPDAVSAPAQSSVPKTPSNSSTYRNPFRYHPKPISA